MTLINVKLEATDYERLKAEAARLGKTPDSLIRDWIVERLKHTQASQAVTREQPLGTESSLN